MTGQIVVSARGSSEDPSREGSMECGKAALISEYINRFLMSNPSLLAFLKDYAKLFLEVRQCSSF